MQFHVYENPSEMSEGAAEWIATYIIQTLQKNPTCSLLLSGGNTPKELYKTLSNKNFLHKINWQRVDIFFADERYVPFTDEHNNGRMAYDLLLKPALVPSSRIHFINTNVSREDAVASYEKTLRSYFKNDPHTFDFSLLGIGNDGHTLSLFPGQKELYKNDKWVIASEAPEQPVQRISLTPDVVNKSSCIAFLVSGKRKAVILDKVVRSKYDPDLYPVQVIKNNPYNVHLFADRPAVEQLLNNTA